MAERSQDCHRVVLGELGVESLGGVMSLWLAETDPAIGGVGDVEGLPFLAAAMDPTATADKAMQMGAGMRQQLLAAPHDQFVGFMHQFLAAMVSDPANAKMLDDGAGSFALAPWRPVLLQRVGQAMTVTIEHGSVSWQLGASRRLGR